MNIAIDAQHRESPAEPCVSREQRPPRACERSRPVEVSRVRTGVASDVSDWLRVLHDAPGATLFHEPLWCGAVERVFGHEPCVLLARRAGRPVGVLPLMRVRSALAGTRLISMPYATLGGVISADADAAGALAEAAEQLAVRYGASIVELRSRTPGLRHWNCDAGYVEFATALPAHASALDSLLPRKARAAARQAAQREGLRIRHDRDDLGAVWELYSRSMRRLGSLNYPRRFFVELFDACAERAWVTSVWKGARMVAGVLSFVDRRSIRPYFAGVDERLRCTGCTNLLYRAVMERAVRSGLTQFDFGRTRRDNHGALEFKRHQGFAPRPLGYQSFSPAGRRPADLSPSNPRFGLARRVWPHLPLALTRPLGAWLSRAIPG